MLRAVSRWRYELGLLAVLLALAALLPVVTTGRLLPVSILPTAAVAAAPLLLHAAGVLVVMRACGFLNLAQVQVGLFAGVLFEGIVRGQKLLTGLHAVCETCVGYVPGPGAVLVNLVVAAVVSLAAAVLISWLIYVLVIQRFTTSPLLMSTVVTIFLAQALAGLQPRLIRTLVSTEEINQGRARADLSGLPLRGRVELLGTQVSVWSVVLVAVAVLLLAALAVQLRSGGWGLALRAGADNGPRARTLGVSTARVAGRAWAWSGLLGGTVGILTVLATGAVTSTERSAAAGAATDLPQTVSGLVLLLAVLAFARFAHLGMTVVAALVLSVVTTAVAVQASSVAAVNAGYVVVIGGLLLLQSRDGRGRRRAWAPREDTSDLGLTPELQPVPRELRHLDQVRSYARLGGLALAVLLLGAPALLSPAGISLMIETYVFAMVAVSLLVLTGWAGQVSLGQFGFAAIGAWVAVVSGIPFLLAVPLAALVGAGVSVLVGLPALRLRGMYLAVATLAFAVSIQAILFDRRFLGRWVPDGIAAPTVLGLDLRDGQLYYYLTLAALVAACLAVMGLRRSRLGRALIAVRTNEAAAAAFGISPTRIRLLAFMLSGGLAASAGALGAFHLGQLGPTSFAPEQSITVFLYTLVGGLGGLAGPLIGSIFYAAVSFFFAGNALVAYAGAGLGAVLLLMAVPGGLSQLAVQVRDAVLLRLAYRLHIPVPSLMGDGGIAAGMGKAPLDEKRRPVVPAGEDPLPRYRPDGQWALGRLGSDDQERSRVGER